jgi:hypothetical protein
MPYVAEEIAAAISADRVAHVFCGIWYVVNCATGKIEVWSDDRGDETVIRAGIEAAVDAFAQNRDKPVDEHVRSCIAAKLASLRDKRIAQTRKKKPEELLPDVVNWPRPNAAVLLEHLTFKQREALLLLLIGQVPRKSVVISLGEEPADELLWRIWYTAVLLADHPAMRQILEEADRPTIALLGEAWGEPLPEGKSAAAPLHASYYLQLARERRKRGYPIKRPESRRRIARLLGKSRSTIDRYLASGTHVELLGVIGNRTKVRIPFEGIQQAIDAARGEKRGPKNEP